MPTPDFRKAGCRQTPGHGEEATRMDVHQSARTTPYSRALIARQITGGEAVALVARGFGVTDRTARKWARRAAT